MASAFHPLAIGNERQPARAQVPGYGNDRKCLHSAYTDPEMQKAQLAGWAKCLFYLVAGACYRSKQFRWAGQQLP